MLCVISYWVLSGAKRRQIQQLRCCVLPAKLLKRRNVYGTHVHLLDWALHLDESTPHIHERHVFDCENKYGEVAPQQEKALEVLGFNLPDPDKPLSRRNNRKITFTS